MKHFTLALLLWLLAILPIQADGPPIYLPIITAHPCYEVATVSDFKVIQPVGTTNKVKNPSGEIAGNFAALAGTTVTRVTTQQHYGLYSYFVQTNADNEGMTLDLETLVADSHWVTMRVKDNQPPAWDVSLDNATYTEPTLLEEIDTEWSLYGVEIPSNQATGSVMLWIRQKGAGSGNFYIDGVQVEQTIFLSHTTYCDGTQEGCEWNGAEHASSSTRSPDSRAGGIVRDLEDDYGFLISGMSGTGTAPQELFIDSYSQLPGGELNARKVGSRVITLTGVISGTTEADFYEKKQTLEILFDPEAFPEDENGEQPVRLRFVGASVHKEIAVFYEDGFGANITADDPCAWERVAIRFIADDPYWYEIGESAALLDTTDSATFETIAARLRSTGQWDPLGPPNASGTYASVRAIVEDATYVYIGGDFLNFDNIAAADYIVRRNKATGVYTAMAALNGIVRAMAIAPNGDVIVAGEFTNASGVAAADYIAVWASGASAFAALGVPVSGAAAITRVRALTFDSSGNLYIGGDFTDWANVAAADGLVMWNGSAYVAVSTGTDGGVNALAFGNGLLYIGGNFNLPYVNLAAWDGSAFVDLGGADSNVNSLAVAPNGIVYIGGAYTIIGGVSASRIAAYNGSVMMPLSTGVNGTPNALAMGPDGILILGGTFGVAGGLNLTDTLALWNGSTFAHLGIDLPGTSNVFSLLASKYADPVVPSRYSLYVGFDESGTGTYGGLETISNGGTAPAFPKIIFNRSGGTGATIQSLKNEKTGLQLFLNWPLQNGETLTIDLAPTKKSITSSTGLPAQSAVLFNSDLGDWALLTGNNDITSFVSTSGSPTVTGYLLWKDTYKSQN